MLVLLLFSVSAGLARGAVLEFPAPVRLEFRRAVADELRLHRPLDAENWAIHHRIGVLAASRLTLEEVNAYLAHRRRPFPGSRVEGLLRWLATLPSTPAMGTERALLRARLAPLITSVTRARGLEKVLDIAVNLKIWEPRDVLKIDLTQARRQFLIDYYPLIVASTLRLSEAEADDVAVQLLANPTDPLLRFAIVDELDRLPAEHDAMTLRLLRLAFQPHDAPLGDAGARAIHFDLLERWQDRLIRGDARVAAALIQVQSEVEDGPGANFLRRLALGTLPTEVNERSLRARDPLRLDCGAALVSGR